jgi:formylglycine-generating enzyme required for sulfatase activity
MIQPRVKGKKGLWQQLVKGAKSVFSPRIYAAEIVSYGQIEATEKNLAATSEWEAKKEELRKLDLMLREAQHKEQLAAQTQEGELGREAQLQLARFQQEFAERQALMHRDHTEKLELFRADLQRWVVQQQKELQLELKQIELEQARELRLLERETALEVIRSQKRANNSPIWLLAEDLIGHSSTPPVLPLRVLFSPPGTGSDQDFPEMERSLGRDLRQFFDSYSSQGRPIEFLAGAWNGRFFHSEAATKAIFRGLKTEPVIILEAMVEGEMFDLNFAYWGVNWPNYRYKTAVSLSWREALVDFAKARTLLWVQKQQELRRDRTQMVSLYGETIVSQHLENLQIYRREQECLRHGEDPRAIERPYHLQNQDYEDLRRFVGVCHCLFAGILADEYFLLHVSPQHRQPPLLPALLEALLQDIPDSVATELTELVVNAYETIYETIAQSESSWVPEFHLDLAHSLLDLPQQFRAQEKVDASIAAWLAINGIAAGTDRYVALGQNLGPVDLGYVEKLNECLARLGHSTRFDVTQACLDRGEAAMARTDFTQAELEFLAAVQANAQRASAHLGLGQARIRLGQLEAALGDLNTAIQLDGHLGPAYYHRGLIYEQQQKLPQAAADYRRADQEGVAAAHGAAQHLHQYLQDQRSAADLARPGIAFTDTSCRLDDQGQLRPLAVSGRLLTLSLPAELALELVYIPGGSFRMGSTAQRNERPPHSVEIAPLHMGRYPIRQDQWAWVASLPTIERILETHPSQFLGADRPVDNVSWLDAIEFCRRLSHYTGQEFRLPSEAEWEYACRAHTTTAFSYGDVLTPELANFSTQATTPMGSYRPNGWGLYDMHGNIWEWCSDLWHDSYQDAPPDGQPWLSQPTSDHRVLRGGSWFNNPWNCRSSNRNWVSPEVRSWLYGLRVVSSSYCQPQTRGESG